MATIDYLDEDPELRGQKYVCLSFLSPEEVIQEKNVYFFNKFLASFSDGISNLFENIKNSEINNISPADMANALKQRHDYLFSANALSEEFQQFKSLNSESLEKEYLEVNNFQTTIRGIKVRGSYETLKEAQNRAEMIKKFDKNFNVYVAQVGCWCPWSPNPDEIENVEYSESQMNTLMKKYKENQVEKDEHFRARRDQLVAEASAAGQANASNAFDASDASNASNASDAM